MKYDKLLFIAVIILSLFGLLMVYSSSSIWALYKFNDSFKYVKNQGFFFIIGIILIFIINRFDIKLLEKFSNKFLFISFILLVLVLIPGIGSIRNGSRSWFSIMGFGVQPSEFSKLALIIYTAKYLSHNDKYVKNIKKGIFPLFIIIILFFLVIMLEPDFGTAVVIVLTLIGMIFVSGPNISFFVGAGIVCLVGVVILVLLAPYRMARIVAYLNPWSDPLGSGFQIIMSLFALVPFSLLGSGFGNSIQKNFYLPEPQTDFIFSIIVEEFGLLGVIIILGLFSFIFYRCIYISLKQIDLFKKYLVFGLSFGIILQALLNICVVTGIIPTTGITLPFISYGGSSLLISMISIGIILNVSKG